MGESRSSCIGRQVKDNEAHLTKVIKRKEKEKEKERVKRNATTVTFEISTKHILSSHQLEDFQNSQTHANIVTFVEQLVGRTEPVLNIPEQVEGIARQTPPIDNKASRFGNPAFRTFYTRSKRRQAPTLHAELGVSEAATPELQVYFINSWGNRERIDYGSGMELNFLCWLYSLRQLGLVDERDHKSLAIRVMRLLQSTTGSNLRGHIEDGDFLLFLFGSAQLQTSTGPTNRRVPGHHSPKAIHVPEIVDELEKGYMYFACIRSINSIKTASLQWHSPMLDDISAVKTWDKMYNAEVFGKLPVVQLFLFGSILPYTGRPPSGFFRGVFAAAQEEGARQPRAIEGPGIRPVPFD
ncbi:hypothetical protein V8E55_001227 [Tylopilus felleus]